jgi:hypothetical protein
MKPLNNPWIVGGLCVIAAGVVIYQTLAPRGSGGIAPNDLALLPATTPTGPATGAFASSPSEPARTTARTTLGTNVAPPAPLINLIYVQSHLTQWMDSPPRDPFLFSPPGKPAPAPAAPASPLSHWKLKAIWRQTGSRLAAINNGVYAEGDWIEGYRIERIESDCVWFQGPLRRESLGFTKPQPPPAPPAETNAPNR